MAGKSPNQTAGHGMPWEIQNRSSGGVSRKPWSWWPEAIPIWKAYPFKDYNVWFYGYLIWLVVWKITGLWLSIWEFHHPIWLIFFRGVETTKPTSHCCIFAHVGKPKINLHATRFWYCMVIYLDVHASYTWKYHQLVWSNYINKNTWVCIPVHITIYIYTLIFIYICGCFLNWGYPKMDGL